MYIEKLRKIFAENKKRIFVHDSISGKELTYGQLEKLSLQFAVLLKNQGINEGDKVAIVLPNCLEFIIIYFGCMQAGAIAVPVNPLLHQDEAEYIITNCQARLLIMSKEIENKWNKVKLWSDGLKRLVSDGLFGRLGKINIDGLASFQKVRDQDAIAVIYTSGTTGRSKGAVVSYWNVVKNGIVFADTLGVSKKSRFLGILSLAHMGGWYNLTLIPFVAEASLVLADTFNAETSLNFWDTVIKYKVDTLWFVPTIMSILLSLDRGDKGRLYCKHNVRLAMAGTAPLFLKLKKEFEQKYGIIVYENYGISETCFISTNAPKVAYKENSVGTILPGCDAKIIDIDTGRILPAYKEGEIAVKTDYFMKGYFGDSSEPLKFYSEKYFLTGDIGFLDEDNYVYITGRKKDLIIRGGINISPREIEEVLRKNEHVIDVAVVGIKDEVYGENIAAVIKLAKESKGKVSEREIAKFCLDKLAPFKCPGRIYFIYEFPRNVAGKIQKNKLKTIIENLPA